MQDRFACAALDRRRTDRHCSAVVQALCAEIIVVRNRALGRGRAAGHERTIPIEDRQRKYHAGRQQILSRGLAQAGERVVVTAGVPFDVPGTTNLLKIESL